MTTLKYDVYGCTETGQIRDHNEDAFFFVDPADPIVSGELLLNNGHLLIVADGVGGAQGGHLASNMLVERLVAWFYQERQGSIQEHLVASIEAANSDAHERVQVKGASTTLVAGVIHDDVLYLAHVGDSRAYLIRNRNMLQLTQDHAFGNRLLRYLVSTQIVDVELQKPIMLQPDDQILLCSDGLYRELPNDKEIVDVVGSDSAEEVSYQLVRLANERGGRDNITVVLAQASAIRKPPSAYTARWESI